MVDELMREDVKRAHPTWVIERHFGALFSGNGGYE